MIRVNVRARAKDGTLLQLGCSIHEEVRADEDAVNDAVGDILEDNGIRYKWFKVERVGLVVEKLKSIG